MAEQGSKGGHAAGKVSLPLVSPNQIVQHGSHLPMSVANAVVDFEWDVSVVKRDGVGV